MIDCPPCVICEVDGLPLDPDRLAQRQAADKEARDALERLLAAPARPAAVIAPVEALTPVQRGQARRQAIEDATAGQVYSVGTSWGMHTTGYSDRRQSSTTSRVRGNRALGRTKKPRTVHDR